MKYVDLTNLNIVELRVLLDSTLGEVSRLVRETDFEANTDLELTIDYAKRITERLELEWRKRNLV